MTLEPNEGEETIGLAVLGFAIREAWEPPEPPPVRRARIGIVATGKRLCGESSDEPHTIPRLRLVTEIVVITE